MYEVIYRPLEGAEHDGISIIRTPHCMRHGAMNKVATHEDGGGIWRCITVVNNNASTVCRKGVIEKKIKI